MIFNLITYVTITLFYMVYKCNAAIQMKIIKEIEYFLLSPALAVLSELHIY